jgi:hypothetical protein
VEFIGRMGMSDDEMRKLGITDPKVLAMIRAHSLPPSGNQQQPPGERFNQGHQTARQGSSIYPPLSKCIWFHKREIILQFRAFKSRWS